MLHHDVYKILDVDTDQVLGFVAIAVEPGTTQTFSYYFRDPDGTYTHLMDLHGLDVIDVKDLEQGKIWQTVDKHLESSGVPRKFVRLNDFKWGDVARISPNVSVQSWLSNYLYLFEED